MNRDNKLFMCSYALLFIVHIKCLGLPLLVLKGRSNRNSTAIFFPNQNSALNASGVELVD